ncbi:MAG: hypothetical protein GY913_32230 [Proteobacteria bacterium]|nr:hypothetical protein [Pseudomonadota bacterium]MCP4921590.1 hypothetical protein [Pseudomonadota bacterium]
MLLLLAACTGGEPPTRTSSPLDASWLGTVTTDPAAFTAVVDADRDGWVAYHRSDLLEAVRTPGPAGVRARADLASLHADLGELSSAAWASTMTTWEDKGELPEGSALTWFAALAALEAGDTEQAAAWLEVAKDATDPVVRAAATTLAASPALDQPVPGGTENALIERLNANLSVRTTGQVEPLGPDEAIFSEAAGEHERVFFDPQRHWSLAQVYAVDALPTGLEGQLFSACIGDVTEGCGAHAALALGVDPGVLTTDDAETARQLVRDLDVVLDAWTASWRADLNSDGLALLDDLALVPRLRAAILLDLSREALADDRPRQALALSQLALDLEAPRDLGPVNLPGLYAVQATAQLRSGHVREALDSLHVLTGPPLSEAHGVDEIVGDVAILRGLDRQGDSKEN